jgi:hypothetical protein
VDVCKTSIPGSNPGGASKITKKFAHLSVWLSFAPFLIAPKRTCIQESRSRKSLIRRRLSVHHGQKGGGFQDLQLGSNGAARWCNARHSIGDDSTHNSGGAAMPELTRPDVPLRLLALLAEWPRYGAAWNKQLSR